MRCINDSYKKYCFNGVDLLIWHNGSIEIEQEGRILEPYLNHDGYPVVCIYNKLTKQTRSPTVHRLVALAWIPNDDLSKTEVNHKDFNRGNYQISNLEWCTRQYNIAYSRSHNRYTKYYGCKNPNYGNDILSKKYRNDKILAKTKQARIGSQNGKSKTADLFFGNTKVKTVLFLRDAVNYLVDNNICPKPKFSEVIIKKLKSKNGFHNYFLKNINQ